MTIPSSMITRDLANLRDSDVIEKSDVACFLGYKMSSLERLLTRAGFPLPHGFPEEAAWRVGDLKEWKAAGRKTTKVTRGGRANQSRFAVTIGSTAFSKSSGRNAFFMFSVVNGERDLRDPFSVVNITWQKFVEDLQTPSPRGIYGLEEYLQARNSIHSSHRSEAREQEDGPAWIPAILFDQNDSSTYPRHSENVSVVTALVLDISNESPNAAQLSVLSLINMLPPKIALAWHTTYAHTTAKPCFRMIIPWKTPAFVSEHSRIFAALNWRLGGRLDPASRDPSTLFHMPSCPPDAQHLFQFGHRSGRIAKPIDFIK